MKINVEVHGVRVVMPIGDGQQSVRWLGLATSQRYAAIARPDGRNRLRENKDARRGFFLPISVSASNGDCSPDAKLCEIFADGDTAQVVLQESVHVDETGAPVQSAWFRAAFCRGEASKRRAAAETCRPFQPAVADTAATSSAPSTAGTSTRGGKQRGSRPSTGGSGSNAFDVTIDSVVIARGPLLAREGTAGASSEWSSTNSTALLSRHSNQAKALLQEFDAVLASMFDHYAGHTTMANGGEPSLTYNDFAHLVHSASVRHAYRDAEELRSVFNDYKVATPSRSGSGGGVSRALRSCNSTADGSGSSGEGGGLSWVQFLAALVELARRAEGDHMENLQALLLALGKKHWPADDPLRGALTSQEVSASLAEDRAILHSVFLLYADNEDEGSSGEGATITLPSLLRLLEDSGVLSALVASVDGRRRFLNLAEQAFRGAQCRDASSVTYSAGVDELHELVFGEAFEAAARVVYMLDGGNVAEKIRLVVECVIELGLSDRGGASPRK